MIARLQKLITLSLLACSLLWLALFWGSSQLVALAGTGTIVFFYSGFLALEFLALRLAGQHAPGELPSWKELLTAWMGETTAAPVVFCWRQPFRTNEVPDSLDPAHFQPGRRGAVFIHGFACNRAFWTPWLREMRSRGKAFVAVNLEPVFGSIDEYAQIIDQAVADVAQATGQRPVLICHSMGGLAARAWLRTMRADHRVHHVITIGTPHRGTWLGRFSRVLNGQQMNLASDWVTQLAAYGNEDRHAAFTCWYSNCDNIVFPVSTATLPGADNRCLRGVAHVALAFRPEVMSASLAKLDAL